MPRESSFTYAVIDSVADYDMGTSTTKKDDGTIK